MDRGILHAKIDALPSEALVLANRLLDVALAEYANALRSGSDSAQGAVGSGKSREEKPELSLQAQTELLDWPEEEFQQLEVIEELPAVFRGQEIPAVLAETMDKAEQRILEDEEFPSGDRQEAHDAAREAWVLQELERLYDECFGP